MTEIVVATLLGLLVGFALAWQLRRMREKSREALATERMSTLRQQSQDQAAIVLQLKAELTELTRKHLEESNARSAAEVIAREVPELQATLEEKSVEIRRQSGAIVRLETEATVTRNALQQERELLQQARTTLGEAFTALSAEALRNNNQQFLNLAKATLETFQEGARGDLQARQTAVDQLIRPLKESLQKVDAKLGEIEHQRVSSYSALNEQLRSLVETHLPGLHKETANLVKALRQPAVRGRYGEVQLKRVVEMAGMQDHCDFVEQVSRTTEEGRLRPDLIVKLPGGRNIVVDAKTPTGAYLSALEATDEETQREYAAQHARQCRNHITELSRKAYWDQFNPTPEFVVMFIPGEVFFSAALQQDPELLEYGVNEKVIMATPTTLIALLKAIAYGWRQEQLAENAEQIAQLGRELYERIRKVGNLWADLGDRLRKAVDSYNNATNSLESRLLVSARRFRDLKASGPASDITVAKPIDVMPRALQSEDMLPEAPSGEPSSGSKEPAGTE